MVAAKMGPIFNSVVDGLTGKVLISEGCAFTFSTIRHKFFFSGIILFKRTYDFPLGDKESKLVFSLFAQLAELNAVDLCADARRDFGHLRFTCRQEVRE